MIRLDNRLQTMAELIPEGKVLADIGTDHGYLPTALVLAGKFPRAIASDKNEEPAMAALRTVRAAGLSDAISVRTGDGLSSLTVGEADVISISGTDEGNSFGESCSFSGSEGIGASAAERSG